MSKPKLAPIPPAEKKLLYVLAGVQFTHILDFVLMMPLGPLLARDMSLTPSQFGLLVSSYSLAACVAGVLCAVFVERFERKRVLLTMYALFILATVACALAPNYHGLMLARVLSGAFGGVLGALVATVAGDQIAPERRGRAMGLISAAFSLSSVLGVPLGLWLANHVVSLNWRAPFLLVAGLSTLIFFAAYKIVPYRAKSDALTEHHFFLDALHRLRETLMDKAHQRAVLFACLVIFSGFCVIPFLTLYSTGTLHFPENMLSLMYLLGGTCTLVTSRIIGKQIDVYGARKVFKVLAVAAMVPVLINTHIIYAPVWLYLIFSTLFFVFTSGRFIPTQTITVSAARPDLRGTFMSLSASFQQAAMGLGSLITGHLVSTDANGVMHGFEYAGYMSVTATLLALWLVNRIPKRV